MRVVMIYPIPILKEFDALTCSFDSLEKILKKGVAL